MHSVAKKKKAVKVTVHKIPPWVCEQAAFSLTLVNCLFFLLCLSISAKLHCAKTSMIIDPFQFELLEFVVVVVVTEVVQVRN